MYSVEGIQKVSRQFSHYARIETIVFKHGVNQSYLSNIDYAINVCVSPNTHLAEFLGPASFGVYLFQYKPHSGNIYVLSY